MADDELILRDGSVIPRSLLAFSAVTSSGPGGQHVNRSNTAVELRVAVDDLPLTPEQRALVRERLQNRITRSGELRVEASAERSQLRNRRTAEQRLVGLLDAALTVDPERTATRRSRGVRARERSHRQQAQARRASRRWTPDDDQG
jgi:ribosome-associated protein